MPWPSGAPSRRWISDIIYVALFGSEMQKAAEKLGLPLAREGFSRPPVRRRRQSGFQVHSRLRIKDPAAPRAGVRMVRTARSFSRNGKGEVDVHTLCVHGDEATGVAVAGGASPQGAGRCRDRV